MKTIGFVICGKENEERRALLPNDVARLTYPHWLMFEQGYGDVAGTYARIPG